MKIKTKWDLSVLYTGLNDPKIELDTRMIEKAYERFARRYRNADRWLTTEKELLGAFKVFEKLTGKYGTWRPLLYLHYRTDLDSGDQKAQSLKAKLEHRLVKAGNEIEFFRVRLSKIPREKQNQFLRSESLAHFRYYLEVLFAYGRHTLTEVEEKILNLKALPARQLWIEGNEKLLGRQTIHFEGRDMAIPEAINNVVRLPTARRRKLHRAITSKLKNISHFAESEINALYTDKKISDELRGFRNPWDATVLSYENKPETVTTVVAGVEKHFNLSRDFYHLKAKLLKERSLTYADRAASIGSVRAKLTFAESQTLLKRSFIPLGSRYVKFLRSFLNRGQVDVYPRQGKTGGAYCSSSYGSPTFILLNHVDGIASARTFGHELGHAFHSELSRVQSPLYSSYSLSSAEVASTFFEGFVFDELLRRATPSERTILLHDALNDTVSTLFRQVACFNFEADVHSVVRTQGGISAPEIAALHNKHMAKYLGPTVKLEENDGYFFVTWSHLRRHFYVYSYALGELVSRVLIRKVKDDQKYMREVEKFLSAGGSASPEDIFRSVGVNISSPSFVEEGMKSIQHDIHELEHEAHALGLL